MKVRRRRYDIDRQRVSDLKRRMVRVGIGVAVLTYLVALGGICYLSFSSPTVPTGDQTVPYTEHGSIRGYLTPGQHTALLAARVFCVAEPVVAFAVISLWSAMTCNDKKPRSW